MGRIVLTFKNNPQEKEIERFLNTKLSPAGYIKELVWYVMNDNNSDIVSMPKILKSQDNDPADGFNFNLED